MPKPDLSRIPQYYHNYINQVQGDNIPSIFTQHQQEPLAFLNTIPNEKWDYAYAEGKWSIKEMVQHIIDAERIFCYRALCFARKDKTSLPGFDENTYAQYSKANNRTKEDLLAELSIVQKGAATLFASFDEEQLNATGTANGKPIYVLGIGFIIVGHTLHHLNILKERYL
jgi:uncharacterized damage-inducible protein DinB